MSQYYFHLRVGDRLITDEDGMECGDEATARSEAVSAAREVAAERVKSGKPIGDDQFEVFDENGALFVTTLRSVVLL